jgi:hypothetical protein
MISFSEYLRFVGEPPPPPPSVPPLPEVQERIIQIAPKSDGGYLYGLSTHGKLYFLFQEKWRKVNDGLSQ